MHTCSLPDKTPSEMVHGKKPNLHDTYKWEKDVYTKIKQDNEISHQAMKVKQIGHSSQSNVLSTQNYVVFFLVFLLFSPRFYNHSYLYYCIWKGTFYIWLQGQMHARFITQGNHT